MISNLQLKRIASHSRLSAVDEGYDAWWIAGRDPSRWISVLVDMGIPQDQITLNPLMNGVGQVQGVFIRSSHCHLHLPCEAVPYREYVPRFWVPWDAELTPAVSEDESIQLMDGLVFFADGTSSYLSDSDGLGLSDLIDLPCHNQQAWNFAVPVDVARPKVRSVALLQPVELDDVMEEAGEGIGDKSTKELLSKSEKMLEDMRNGLGKGKGLVSGPGKFLIGGALFAVGSLGAMGHFLNRFGTGSSIQHNGNYDHKPGLLDQLADWLRRKKLDIGGTQHRELDRLVNLLKNDPDKGLQFAIPLGGDAGRGRAASEAFLGRQNVDFNLSNLGFSGQIDAWDMAPDTFAELQKAYRDAANREVTLGRHRKAAYIYGNLLMDLPAAAEALKQGGYYDEAAQVYLKKLGNKRKAAECYSEAGMIEKSITLYEEMDDHLAIAHLYRRLGMMDLARGAFLKEIERLVDTGQSVKAAEIYRVDLENFDQAIKVLQAAWPDANDAEAVLAKELEWYAELKRHEAACARVHVLIQNVEASHAGKLALILAQEADQYPDPAVVDELRDVARLAIAYDLKHDGSRLSVSASNKLGAGDKIFRRDVQRYHERLKKEEVLKPVSVAKRGGIKAAVSRLEVVGSVTLPKLHSQNFVVTECHRGFILVNGSSGHLLLVRGAWAGCSQVLHWKKNDLINPKRIGIHETNEQMDVVVDVHPTQLEEQSIRGSVRRGEKNIRVRFTNAEFDDVVAADYDDEGNLLELRVVNHELVIASKSPVGAVLTRHLDSVNHLLDASLLKDQLPAMKMLYAHGDIYILTGVSLIRVTSNDVEVVSFPWDIHHLKPSPTHGRPRLFLYGPSGAAMVWLDKKMQVLLLDEVSVLGAVFTPDGLLVCRHRDRVSVRTAHSEETLKYPNTLELPNELNSDGVLSRAQLLSTGERGEVAFFLNREVIICRLRQ